MKKSRFTEAQIMAVLRQAEGGVPVPELCREDYPEEVYLHACKTVSEARVGIGRYLTFYNSRRPHSSLDRLNCPPFRPDSRHKQKGSSTGLRVSGKETPSGVADAGQGIPDIRVL
ncbi:hypothetical protein SAMN05880561_1111 [Rhizobium sp. RU33A]|nr:hypothetical protein SAMN05880561_1111 [Rhizobium sp. RU33A]